MQEADKKRVLILGASGFLGYYVLKSFEKHQNVETAVLVRSKKEDARIPTEGYKLFFGNILKHSTLKNTMSEFKPHVVINLVGILRERPPRSTFKKLHILGVKNIVKAAKSTGVEKIIHVSAIGALKDSATRYLRTKAIGEDIIKDSGLVFTIFRPAIMFGWRAPFTKKIAKYIKTFPIVPVPGAGEQILNPVAAETVADCIAQSANLPPLQSFKNSILRGDGRIYDVVGPERMTLRELVNLLGDFLGEHKRIVGIPILLLKIFVHLRKLGVPVAVTKSELYFLINQDIGSNTQLKSDFEVRDIFFSSSNNYPLV